ncbi:MAG: ferritin family protein [Armatimonadota bacterium]
MNNTQQSLAILTRLMMHEEGIQYFYEECANQFPEHDDFWLKLAREERGHVESLRSLTPLIEEEKITVPEAESVLAVLDEYLQYLTKQSDILNNSTLSVLPVISMALDMEESLLEKRFFTYLSGEAPELQNLIQGMLADTLGHAGRLAALKNEIKQQGASGQLK